MTLVRRLSTLEKRLYTLVRCLSESVTVFYTAVELNRAILFASVTLSREILAKLASDLGLLGDAPCL